MRAFLNLVEEEGFEPSKPFDLHTFQACSFDHSDTPPDQCSHWSPDCVVFPLRTRRILSITFEWRKPFSKNFQIDSVSALTLRTGPAPSPCACTLCSQPAHWAEAVLVVTAPAPRNRHGPRNTVAERTALRPDTTAAGSATVALAALPSGARPPRPALPCHPARR